MSAMSIGLFCSVHLWFDARSPVLNTRDARPRNSLDVNQVEAARARRQLHRIGRQRHALLCGPAREAGSSKRSLSWQSFPRVKEAKLEKVALIKEVNATFGIAPGIDSARPALLPPWPKSVFLAATGCNRLAIDDGERGKVGHLAAEALGMAAGEPLRCFRA